MTTFPIGAKVGADTSAFIGAMGGATRSLQAFTGASTLAKGAIAAGALALGVSVKAAKEYQTELVKLNTLVGIQVEQVEAWDSAIKDLAVETGRAPADLARALFAITSGGARGQEALDLLESSAKASAIGLGDMTTIGRTATAMLQAFGDEGLTAEKAIDIMVATVREGNLEAESLAGAFSRVLGPAKVLGSNVEDIGGFLATFTRLGGSTEQAATGLLNVFNLLIKPPKDAREAMEKYGFSVEEVRATIAADGLPAGLQLMKEGLEGNIDAIGEVIPNTRALIGFLNTAQLQTEAYGRITDSVTNSLGANEEAFKIWGGTADAVFTRFTAQVKVSGIAIGELLLPPISLLIKALTPLIGLLRLSAEGFEEIGRVMASIPLPETLIDFFSRLRGETEEVGGTFTDMVERFEELDPSEINNLIDIAINKMKMLTGEVERGTLTDESANVVKQELGQTLSALRQALRNQTAAEVEAQEVIRDGLALTEEQIEAQTKRREEVEGLVGALQNEILLLQEGERAVLAKNLVDLEAGALMQTLTLALFDKAAALNAEADAEKESTREKERSAKVEERRLESLKKTRERETASARRALERIELARLNAEMQEAKAIAQDFAETLGTAFESIVGRTKSVSDAFTDMVTDILKQVQRLLIQRAIIEPLIGAIAGQFLPGSGGGFGSPAGGITPGGFDFSGLSSIAVSGAASLASGGGVSGAAAAGAQTIVQQTVNLNVNAIDQRSGEKFLRENSGTIAGIIGDGVQQSEQFASAVRGGRG